MLRQGSSRIVIVVLASLLAMSAVAVLSAGCGVSDPGKAINNIKDQTSQVARQANLAAIESAISYYEAQNNEQVPTSITQLASYLGGKVPADPLGGTYYIYVENGVAKAGVR